MKMTRFRKVVMAVVLFSIIWGSVFAVVQILQGRITATVNVTQWVLVDAQVMPAAGTIMEPISATLGFTTYGILHTLKLADVATKVLTVSVVSEQAPELQVFQEFKLTEPNDLVRFTNELVTWETFESISFEYYIESGSKYIPHVNIYLENVGCLMTSPWLTDTEIGVWKTVTYNKADFTIVTGSPAGGKFGPKYGFTVESYWNWQVSPPFQLADPQVVWFRYVTPYNIADEAIDITGLRLIDNTHVDPTGATVLAQKTVDFRIGYYPTAGVGTTTVKTDINLIGEAEAGHFP
jgi:hypothetical protein